MKRIWAVVLIIVLLGGAGIAGWKVWDNRDQNKNPSPQQKTLQSNSEESYKDWKSYSSSNLGLSFKYPSNWTVIEGTPQCTGSLQVKIVASMDDISVAAREINNVDLKKYTIALNRFGTVSQKCAPDGNDFKNSKYDIIKTTNKILAGAFRNSSLTFFGSTTGSPDKLPDTGILLNNFYNGSQNVFQESGTIMYGGKTYQLIINTDTGQYTQSSVPVGITIQPFEQTDLYKKTIKVIESMN